MTPRTDRLPSYLLPLLLAPSITAAATLHVPADHPTIQACIDAAVSGQDECVVAPGTYVESINFNGKAITLRSSDGPEVTTIDGNGAYHVVQCISGEGPDTVLEGFTITGGLAERVKESDPVSVFYGGGIYIAESSPTVAHCHFRNNRAVTGGGAIAIASKSRAIITNCYFELNRANFGGAIHIEDSDPHVFYSTFIRNGAGQLGGGIYLRDSRALISTCSFVGNTALLAAAGVSVYLGAPTIKDSLFVANASTALIIASSRSTVIGCIFLSNIGLIGGAMRNEFESNTMVQNCAFIANEAVAGGGMYNYSESSPTVVNSLFVGNKAIRDEGIGGAMRNSGKCNPLITHCTFVGNIAKEGGGIANRGSSNPTIYNSIIWDNVPDQILNSVPAYNRPVISFSILQGTPPPGASLRNGVFDADPEFRDPFGPDGVAANGDEDYRLGSCSPAVDAGYWRFSEGVELDLDGNPRVIDDPAVTDRGERHVYDAVVDLGTYERQYSSDQGTSENITQRSRHCSIQDAINQAMDGDEVVVPPGVHYESINFVGRAITLRSTAGPEHTALDGGGAFHVVQCVSGEGPTTVLKGFTITGGRADGEYPDDCGGGMYNYASSPTVKECQFIGNAGDLGAGMGNREGSNPTVLDSVFSENVGATSGGGMYNYASSPTVEACQFIGNAGDLGAGMGNREGSNPTVVDSVFSENVGATSGGGMYNYSSSPSVEACQFIANVGESGAGMANRDGSNPTVVDCLFSANVDAIWGGGMDNYASSPVVRNCHFTKNVGGAGGGMSNREGSSPTVVGSTFSKNGEVSVGGGIYNLRSSPTVIACMFDHNRAYSYGGAITNAGQSNASAVGCVFRNNWAGSGGAFSSHTSSPLCLNCSFIANKAEFWGGAMLNEESSPVVIGGTFTRNRAGEFGGAIFNYIGSNPVLSNSIVWQNTPHELHDDDEMNDWSTVSFSSVAGGLLKSAIDGGGNIDADPMFVRVPNDGGDGWGDDPETLGVDEGANDDYGDLRLQPGSPCINAGSAALLPLDEADIDNDGDSGEPLPLDLDGHPRVLCGQVDMGAYEYGIGDFDCNGLINLADSTHWALCMIEPGGPYPEGCEALDYDGDQTITLYDFARFQSALTP